MLKTADRRDPPALGAAWWAWCSPCRCVRTGFAAWSAGEISLHTFDETILEGGACSGAGWDGGVVLRRMVTAALGQGHNSQIGREVAIPIH